MGPREFYKKYKVELWRYSIFNSRAATEHLNQMAEKGMHFVTLVEGVLPMAVYLKDQKKRGVRFAMDVFQENKEEPEGNYERLYEDVGWEAMEVECSGGIKVYRSTKEDLQLPYNDEETEILHLAEHGVNNAMIGKRMGAGACGLLCGYMLAFWIDFAGSLEVFSRGLGFLTLLMGVLQVFSCIFNSTYINAQEKRIRQGRSLHESGLVHKLDYYIESIIRLYPVGMAIYAVGFITVALWNSLQMDGLPLGMAISGTAIMLLIFIWLPLMCIFFPMGRMEDSKKFYNRLNLLISIAWAGILLFIFKN